MSLMFPISLSWNYAPNAVGPVLTPNGTDLVITRPNTNGTDETTYFYYPLPITTGWEVAFEIRYDKIWPLTEVKLILAANVILRFDPNTQLFSYNYFDTTFRTIGQSNIQIGDDLFHRVAMKFGTNSIVIAEDGVIKGAWDTSTSTAVPLTFHWQVLANGTQIEAAMSNIMASPSSIDDSKRSIDDLD